MCCVGCGWADCGIVCGWPGCSPVSQRKKLRFLCRVAGGAAGWACPCGDTAGCGMVTAGAASTVRSGAGDVLDPGINCWQVLPLSVGLDDAAGRVLQRRFHCVTVAP